MTVASTITQKLYTCNGATTQFSFPNKVFTNTDLTVTLYDTASNPYLFTNFANAATGISYSVLNVDVDTGCIIQLSSPPANAWQIDIRSNTPELQSTSIKNQGQFLPELHEEAFDKLTRIVQDLLRLTYTYGIHASDNEETPWPALPAPSVRKGYGLVFDAVTGLPEIGFLTAQIVSAGLISPLIGWGVTPQETANSVVPILGFAPGDLRRYGADPTGVADSHTALLNACKCNADVFDGYPGGGTYLFNSETVIPNYPITIRGQAKAGVATSSGNVGTIFKLATVAGAGAACLRTNAFTFGLNVRGIGFQYQILTTGQIGIRCTNDLRSSSITDCAFGGSQAPGTTVIGIQCDGAAVFSGDVVIRDNYFSALIKGVWLQGNCTTFKIYGNELYGYVGGVSAGQGIQMDYPVTEPSLMNNYFEGWANGIFGNGSAYQRQIGNDYAVCTQPFTWTKTTYSFVRGLCLDGNSSGVAPVLSFADVDGNSVFGIMGYFASSSGPMQSTRGYQEGNGSALRSYNMGYPQPVTFASGNYTGNGSMTFGSVTQTVFEFAITGKTLTIWLNISGTVGGTPNTALQVALPGGFIGNLISNGAATILNNGAWSQSAWQVNASGTVIQFFSTSAGSVNWTAGAVAIQASLSIQVA